MSTSVQCIRVNHLNVVLEDFDASIEHFVSQYGAQDLAHLPATEWNAALVVIGRVMWEMFTPHAWLLNSRYGPHYLGIEYQITDLEEGRRALEERGIRVLRDLGVAVHTDPADAFGISFELFEGTFHEEPMSFYREPMKPAEYWLDEHPLGLTGLVGYRIAVDDADALSDFLQGFLRAEVRYDEARPEIGARAIGLHIGDAIAEVLAPVDDGAIDQHLRRWSNGIRSTVLGVRDLGVVERHFADRGITLEPGDSPGSLAVPASANRGIRFEFSE